MCAKDHPRNAGQLKNAQSPALWLAIHLELSRVPSCLCDPGTINLNFFLKLLWLFAKFLWICVCFVWGVCVCLGNDLCHLIAFPMSMPLLYSVLIGVWNSAPSLIFHTCTQTHTHLPKAFMRIWGQESVDSHYTTANKLRWKRCLLGTLHGVPHLSSFSKTTWWGAAHFALHLLQSNFRAFLWNLDDSSASSMLIIFFCLFHKTRRKREK